MSNIKISQLTTATPLTGAELVPIVQDGGTVQITTSAIAALGTGASAIVEIQASLSVLQVQVNSVSAAVSAQQLQILEISTSVSALQVQVNAVSAAVSTNAADINLRVLKAGDTMTGALVITSVSPVSAGVSTTGFLADSKGDVRDLPILSKTAAYVVSVGDAGQVVAITSGGVTLNQNVFSANDAFSVYNNSASTQTITQGTSVTMYLVGTATTGNRTLAQRGLATVLCVSSNTFVISGGGVT